MKQRTILQPITTDNNRSYHTTDNNNNILKLPDLSIDHGISPQMKHVSLLEAKSSSMLKGVFKQLQQHTGTGGDDEEGSIGQTSSYSATSLCLECPPPVVQVSDVL